MGKVMRNRKLALRAFGGVLGVAMIFDAAEAQQSNGSPNNAVRNGQATQVGQAVPGNSAGQSNFQSPMRLQGPAPVSGAVPSTNAARTTTEAAKLQVYDVPKEMAGTIAARLQVLFSADPSVRVDTVPNNGRLMVYAPESVQRNIALRVQAIRQDIEKSTPGGTGQFQRLSNGPTNYETLRGENSRMPFSVWRVHR